MITKLIELISLPPSNLPINKVAISLEKRYTIKNVINPKIKTINLLNLNAFSLASNIPFSLYSPTILLIAIGNPVIEIVKNKLYIL